MRQQHSLLANGSSAGVPDSVENSMVMFHNHHGDTLRVHDQYLRNQAEISKSALGVLKEQASMITGVAAPMPSKLEAAPLAAPSVEIRQQPIEIAAPPIEQILPVAAPAPAGPSLESLTQSMLEVVSDKTGYPVEMLDLDMEIEADLGIDSIKRVEILGTMMDIYPGLPELNPEELAELRTLRQIVEHMEASMPAAVGSAQPAVASTSPNVTVSTASAERVLDSSLVLTVSGKEAFIQNMCVVVSENTGYPVEMLELDMEMETELSIDRVKLVEILGAIREQYPSLGDIDHARLSELLTLEDLALYVKNRIPFEKPSLQESLVEDSVPQGIAKLKLLPFPDSLEFSLPDNHICLLTDDGTSVTTSLAESLTKRGWKVVVLSFPASVIPQGPDS